MRWIFLPLFLFIAILAAVVLRRRHPRRDAGLLPVTAGLALVLGVGAVATFVSLSYFFAAVRILADAVFLAVPLYLGAAGWWARPRVRQLAWAAAAVVVMVAVWSMVVEPRWLEVNHQRVVSEKLDRPIRLVVVADLQADHWGAYEERVLREIAAQEPDLLLFTGDYFQVGPEERPALQTSFQEAFRRSLGNSVGKGKSIRAIAIEGDVDWGDWWRAFDGLGVDVVLSSQRVELAGLTLTTLSSHDSRAPIHGHPLPVAESDRFHVVMGHAPDFALDHPPADLLLAGHVHGGQVRLPWIGPLVTFSSVPRSWAVGRTDFDDGRILMVSRGLGMERGSAPRLRFLCRPELLVVDLVPAADP